MIKSNLLKIVRSVVRPMFSQKRERWPWPSLDERVLANKLIIQKLNAKEPCMIGRMGTCEGAIVHNRLTLTNPYTFERLQGCWKYISTDTRLPWWDMERPVKELCNNAGFFNKKGVGTDDLMKFSDLYLHYIPLLDICGRFEAYEENLPFNKDCLMVQLETLTPFFVDNPWTTLLEGKNILVVHPFEKTIRNQYVQRSKLFQSNHILPNFNLQTLKAVQSIAGQETRFNDWFEALEFMEEKIAELEFDIAIVGAGAYGLPLAGFIKESLGKKAIHMGGATQLLFGIKGKRWEKQYTNSCYRELFNDFWVYPDESERPKNLNSVENGCYW